jgi:hypothetical protein
MLRSAMRVASGFPWGQMAVRGPSPQVGPGTPQKPYYLLAGLLICGACGRRMESAWSNSKPAYRCRHGHTSTGAPEPGRARNAYVREDRILAHLPTLLLLLTGPEPAGRRRRRTRGGADTVPAASAEDVIGYLRGHRITLTWDPAAEALQAGTPRPLRPSSGKQADPG